MKAIRYMAVCAAAVAALACNKEIPDGTTGRTGTPVNFNMTIGGLPASRTVTGNGSEGVRNVAWRAGDAVGIFVNNESAVHQYVYEAEGDGIWKEAGKSDAIYVRTTDTYSFYSYYPYSSDVVRAASPDAVEAEVFADQSSKTGGNSGYDLSDVLLAARTGVTGDALGNVVMQYSHAFAMVEVFVSGSEVTAAPKTVRLKNVKRSATLDLAAREAVLKADEAAGNVIMCPVESSEESEGWLYRAIVPAQSIAGGDRLLEIELEEKSFYFSSPEGGVTYTAGRYRRIEAIIGAGKTGLTFPAGSIDAWEPAEGTVPPVSGIEIPVDLVTLKIADLKAETYNEDGTVAAPGTFKMVKDAPSFLVDPNNANFVNETSWAMSVHSTETGKITAELVPEENSVRVYSIESLNFNGWYKSGLRFHRVEAFAPGYYRLKFSARKGASATFDQFQVYARSRVTAAHSDKADNPKWPSTLFYIKTGAESCGARKYIKCTDDWVETTVYIDFNRAFSDIYQTTADYKGKPYEEEMYNDAEAYQMLNIAFVPSGNGIADFYVRDVELIKISKADFDAQN